ncbi:class D sortase [Pullulanibacillus sp. KACC 23026]|uniref:class D sortase n=1 Tax=Pullulanibacillus sp. KACC 23026 TaxID=3028315 RepID=UPI0023B053F5|nr:class D sortase [Pullulanibacillus sp. KACC 23026]WEG11765.1 class D sortase [Pullulanibacillus sp. KACC 23026]
MKLTRLIPILFIAAGLLICGYGTFHIWHGHKQEKVTLKKAEALSTMPKDSISLKNFNPYKGDTIGLMDLPKLKATLPIVEGTNENQLAKGVGHYSTSSFPGQHNQIVLSGHRDTVFRHVGDLEKGDQIILHFPFGTFTYTVDHTKIVMADDKTIIHSTKPKEELVLTTCYPFYYIGNAPKRYIIYAYPSKA